MKKALLFILLSTQLFFIPFSESLEQEKLYDFLVKYNNSEEKRKWNWNRLAYAIEKEHVDIASFFISKREKFEGYMVRIPLEDDKRKENIHHKHPFITAIRKGYNELTIEMLQMRREAWNVIEYKDVYRGNHRITIEKKTPFYVAMSEGNEDLSLVQAFLESSFKVNDKIKFQDNPEDEQALYYTYPIHLAIGHHKPEAARLLLKNGSFREVMGVGPISNTKKYVGGTPLYLAVATRYKEGVMILLEYGANPLDDGNGKKISPLELAIQNGNDDLIELLLAAACKD